MKILGIRFCWVPRSRSDDENHTRLPVSSVARFENCAASGNAARNSERKALITHSAPIVTTCGRPLVLSAPALCSCAHEYSEDAPVLVGAPAQQIPRRMECALLGRVLSMSFLN